MEMKLYHVGKAVCQPCSEGVIFTLSDEAASLQILLQSPTVEEKAAFEQPFQFRVAIKNDIVFLLVCMGDCWMDAPIYRWDAPLSTIIYPAAGQGIAIHAMLIDATTGILVAQKLCSPMHTTSMALLTAIQNQPKIPDVEKRLAYTMANYSTVDLLRDSVPEVASLPPIPVCEKCGCKLGQRIGNSIICSSDYIGGPLCYSCQVEHCMKTDCAKCEIGNGPDCDHWPRKQFYLNEED